MPKLELRSATVVEDVDSIGQDVQQRVTGGYLTPRSRSPTGGHAHGESLDFYEDENDTE